MHVLALTVHNILSPKFGGALRVTRLLDQLRQRSHRVSVIRFRTASDSPSPIDSGWPIRDVILPPGYPLAPLAALTHLFAPQAQRLAFAFNREAHIDLVQSDPPWAALTAGRLARKFSMPHVVLSQNCESALAAHISLRGPARRLPLIGNRVADFNVSLLQWAEKRVIAEADLTLTPSRLDRDEMASFGIPIQRVELLPNGTNVRPLPAATRHDMRSRLDFGAETPVAVFVGRLDYPPNEEAVKTLALQIAPRCPGVVFMVIGLNPPQLAWPDNVRLIGYVDQVEEYLSASDLTVVPITFGSGTRIKILDAWAAGLPVLSTSAAASGLEYQDGVDIVIENDLQRFPERILELVRSPARLADLRRGALEAAKPYRWETVGQHYVERLITLAGKA